MRRILQRDTFYNALKFALHFQILHACNEAALQDDMSRAPAGAQEERTRARWKTGGRPLQPQRFEHTSHAVSLDNKGAHCIHPGRQAGGASGHSHSRRPAHSALAVDASQNSVRMAYTCPVTRRRAVRERSRPSYAM